MANATQQINGRNGQNRHWSMRMFATCCQGCGTKRLRCYHRFAASRVGNTKPLWALRIGSLLPGGYTNIIATNNYIIENMLHVPVSLNVQYQNRSIPLPFARMASPKDAQVFGNIPRLLSFFVGTFIFSACHVDKHENTLSRCPSQRLVVNILRM